MSLARVSDLPALTLSDLSEQDRADSYFEFSQVSSGTSPAGWETQRWVSRRVSYGDLRSELMTDARDVISCATTSCFGFVKLGATRDLTAGIYPLSVDSDGRAFTQVPKDSEVANLKYDQWQFVLSSGPTSTVTVTKYVAMVDTPPSK